MTALTFPVSGYRRRAEASRWIVSALAVLLLHAGVLSGLLAWRVPATPEEPPPAAIMIDLAPEPAVPPSIPTPEPEPEPLPDPLPPPEPLPIIIPPAPPVPAPVVEIPPPPPKPIEREPIRHRAEPAPKPRPVPTPSPAAAAPAPEAPPAAPLQAAPVPSAAPTPDMLANFERTLMSHLEESKRYPRAARMRREEGVVELRFTMDRTGKVLSARIDRGSGYADLDEEVLALVKRAEPLPSFPPDMKQERLELVVPVKFFLR